LPSEHGIAEIDEGFGGAVGYLVDEGGLERRAVDRLRDLFLET
jgi:hypothetical protein